mgnify:FL=1|tara:strand:- start:2582 stop:3433 length:852 start_codon:yes stop_codon:yes gene_type:complete
MIVVPHLEWHVTHNCNLSCEGCTHFTNHGHNWTVSLDELKTWFSSWNKKISPRRLAILGGEPLIHKDIVEIVKITHEMWTQPDNSYFELVTNALLIDPERHKDLPKVLQDTKCTLYISNHSKSEEYDKKLISSLKIIERWKDKYDFEVLIGDWTSNWYKAYKGFGTTFEPFEDNNPQKSWDECIAGQTCFQLYNNRIFKCCMTAYLSLQKEKYKDKLSKKWDPYLKYMPLEPGATESEILEFFQRGAESICGMCPANPKKFHHRDPLLPTSFYEKNNFSIDYE